MKKVDKKRDKAFLGAIIGGVLGMAGSAISGAINKNSTEKQLEEQQRQQNKRDTYEMAQNLSAGYGNQEYIDEFKKKVVFKNGGKMKAKDNNYKDRVSLAKKFKCGGRKKAQWGASDTNAVINSLGNVGSSIITSGIKSSTDTTLRQGNMFKAIPKEYIKQPDYITNPNNLIDNNTIYMRCGGRAKNKCGGKSKKCFGGRK